MNMPMPQEYAEKRQIVDEIFEKMNEKEAAIKQGELEEQRLTEEAMELQKRLKEIELHKKERVDATKKQREELKLLRRRLYAAFRECHRARAKAKTRFFFGNFIVKILSIEQFWLI